MSSLKPEDMDFILIEALEIYTIIGIYDWEREIKQKIRIDLEMAWDNHAPATSDHIDDALNYKAVAKALIGYVESTQFQLIETLAEKCASLVIRDFSVGWLQLKLSKPGAVRGSENVAVLIQRSAHNG